MFAIMKHPEVVAFFKAWEDEGRARGEARGLEKGRAEEARAMLLAVIAERSFEVTSDVRARVDDESNIAQLERWLRLAVTAKTIDDVFRDR